MSLTSEVREAGSGFRRWLAERIDGPRGVQATFRARTVGLAPPEAAPVKLGPGELSMVGTTIDHRLRLGFTCDAPASRVARDAVFECGYRALALKDRDEAEGRRWAMRAQLGLSLVKKIEALAEDLALDDRGRPYEREPAQEALLIRLLVCATWFQTLIRRGEEALAGTPLCDLEALGSAMAVLHAVPRGVAEDVHAQLRIAAESELEVLRRATTPGACVAAPTFAGSEAIGGADADLLVGDLLVDVKSTTRPGTLDGRDVYQLLGYLLLDFPDEHRIERVGLYMSRTGKLVTWSTREFLGLLSARTDLATLRRELAEGLARDGRLGVK